MRKLLILVVAVAFCMTVPTVKADTVLIDMDMSGREIPLTFFQDSVGQPYYAIQHFTLGDISYTDIKSVEFHLPIQVTSTATILNKNEVGIDLANYENAGISGYFEYDVTMSAVNDFGVVDIKYTDADRLQGTIDVEYKLGDDTFVPAGTPGSPGELITEATVETVNAYKYMDSEEFFALFGEDGTTTISFGMSEPVGSVTVTDIIQNIGGMFNFETVTGKVVITLYKDVEPIPPVTPEPASMLIFGAAAVAGLPFVRRRFARK